MMRTLAINTTVVLATLAGVAIVIRYPEAVIMFLATLAIAAAARPLVDRLIRRGLKRGMAVLLTFLLIFGLLILLIVVVTPLLLDDLTQLSDNFVISYDYIYLNWPNGTPIQQAIARQLPMPETLYAAFAGEQGATITRHFIGWTTNVLTVVGQFFAVLVLSIYWTIDRIYFERIWLSLLPVMSRARWRAIGRDIETDLGAYVRSELAQSLLAGAILGVGYALIGLPYPALMALFVAAVWLIPWLGALLAVPGIIVHGILTASLPITISTGIFTLIVLLVMQIYVEPRIFARRQKNTWVILLFIMALGDVFGLAGVILAPPLATATVIVFRHIIAASTGSPVRIQPDLPLGLESARQIASLESRIMAVRKMIDALEEKPGPQTESMLNRLEEMVNKANVMLDEGLPVAEPEAPPR